MLLLVILKQTSNAQPAFASYGAAGAQPAFAELRRGRRPTKKKAGWGAGYTGRKFRERMSHFPSRYCIKEYKTILFRKKKTSAGGNYPGRPGNFHLNIYANHYYL